MQTHPRGTRVPRAVWGLVAVAAGVLLALVLPDVWWRTGVVLAVGGSGGYVVMQWSLATMVGQVPAGEQEPVLLGPVLEGRWTAVNSPTSKVPSHGLHLYAQTYAVDLAREEDLDRARTAGAFARPERFASFGTPLRSPVSGQVVEVVDGKRDHRARTGWAGLLYVLVEGNVRGLLGKDVLLGNHVVVQDDAGRCVLLAHVRRGSTVVSAGDRVEAGQLLAECGCSGNSTQPHLHLQVMSGPDARRATGIPFTFRLGAEDVPLPPDGGTLEFPVLR